MKKKGFSVEQIVGVLKQVEVGVLVDREKSGFARTATILPCPSRPMKLARCYRPASVRRRRFAIGNDCTVPTEYGHRQKWVKATCNYFRGSIGQPTQHDQQL